MRRLAWCRGLGSHHTQLPRPQPCSSQGDVEGHTAYFKPGRGSWLSPSLPYTCSALYSEAASERVWTLVLETPIREENGLPVEGRHLSCRRQVGTDLQPK